MDKEISLKRKQAKNEAIVNHQGGRKKRVSKKSANITFVSHKFSELLTLHPN